MQKTGNVGRGTSASCALEEGAKNDEATEGEMGRGTQKVEKWKDPLDKG